MVNWHIASKPLQLIQFYFNIIPDSNIKVVKMNEILINWKTSGLLNKFSLPAHYKIYREQ